MAELRVVVQERERLLREGLAMALGAEPDVELVAACGTAGELVAACEEHRPDLVVLEADAEGWDAPRLVAALRKRQRALRVVALYVRMDSVLATRSCQAGVRALVSRQGGMIAFMAALRSTAHSATVTPLAPPEPAEARGCSPLSDRELEVLELVGSGLTSAAIAGRLGISRKTVENHKQRLFTKLGVQNQAHAVAVAMRNGLLAGRPVASVAASPPPAPTGLSALAVV